MTLNEFKAAIQTCRKQELRSIPLYTLLLLGLAFPASFIDERVKTAGFDFWCILVAVFGFPFFGGLWFYGIARSPQKRYRRLGLVCPTCQKPLVGFSSQVVVATGKCGHCGSQYLSQ
jgi:hypothetical protein